MQLQLYTARLPMAKAEAARKLVQQSKSVLAGLEVERANLSAIVAKPQARDHAAKAALAHAKEMVAAAGGARLTAAEALTRCVRLPRRAVECVKPFMMPCNVG